MSEEVDVKRAVLMLATAIVCSSVVRSLRAADEAGGDGKKTEEVTSFSLDIRADSTDNRDATVKKYSNLDLSVQPRIDLKANGSVGELNMYYAPTWRYRSNPSSSQNDSQLFQDVGLRSVYKATSTVDLRLNDVYTMDDEPSVQKDGRNLRGDTSYSVNRGDIGTRVKMGGDEASEFDVNLFSVTKRFKEADVAKTSDEDGVGGTLNLWYRVYQNVAAALTVSQEAWDYKKVYNADRSFSMSAVAAGMDSTLTPTLRGSARFGVQSLDYKDSSIDGTVQPQINLALHGTASKDMKLMLSAAYRGRESGVFPFASQMSTEFSGTAEWAVKPKQFSVGMSLSYQDGRYDTDTVPATLLTNPLYVNLKDGKARMIVAELHGTVVLEENSSIKLIQRFEDLSSDIRDDYTRNVTSVVLSQRF